MIENYFLGSYWGNRKESVDACVERAVHFLDELARCDSLFARWFETGYSRAEALAKEVHPNKTILKKLLLAGRNRRDADGTIIESLGYSVYLWTGGPEGESAGLSVHCGSYPEYLKIPNNCVIDLPDTDPTAKRVLKAELLTEVLACVARAWEPDQGLVTSRELRRILEAKYGDGHLLGWLTYLPVPVGQFPALPAPMVVRPVNSLGTVVIVTPDRLSSENPKHIDAVDTAIEALARAGILHPKS